MCAVFDAGHLAVLLTGLVQTLVAVDVDQAQLLHRGETRGCEGMQASHWLSCVFYFTEIPCFF